jgi:hypothetical protein
MQKRILYTILTIASFILFYSIIPLDIYDTFFYFLVIVGGLLTTVSAGAFMFTFNKIKEPEKESNFGCVVVPVLLGVFFASSFIFLFHEGEREEKELLKYGVLTQATIVDGSSYKTRKTDFTHLTLEFKTEKGEKYTTDYSIGAGEFNNFYQSQTIPIVYSPRYPQILKIFRRQMDLQKYMEDKSRYKP